MIVRPRPHWFRMLFVLRGSVLPTIAPQLLWTTGFAIAVTMLRGQIYRWKVPLNSAAFSLIGLTLAVFLGFRNNTSYARYWEARTLRGVLLNEAGALLRQAITLVDDQRQIPMLAMRLIAFVHAVGHQLRFTDATADSARLLDASDIARMSATRYKPAISLLMIGEWMCDRRRELAPSLVLAQAMAMT
jgi:putative membrane protein